jgi:beta-phosphoglucomutase family hydrolase
MSASEFSAVIFDLDGVLTRTAHLHARAWKQMFDEFLSSYEQQAGAPQPPFDIENDYHRYVDGKPRLNGARSFLSSRGIDLPEGHPDDPPGEMSVQALAKRKNALFQDLLEEEGVETFADAAAQLKTWHRQGKKLALITSSRSGRKILDVVGLTRCFDTIIDGNDASADGIEGKPSPDVFLEAARRLGVAPEEAVVVEDAISGVEAGHAGGFGLVVGVLREGSTADLAAHGADVVVDNLEDVDLAAGNGREEDHAGAGSVEKDAPAVRTTDGKPPEDSSHPWHLVYSSYDRAQQPLREALCALGNGHIVTRGAFEETKANGVHYPGTYIAGGYNRLPSEVSGRTIENEDLVNWPNWLPLTFRPEGGDWFDIDAVTLTRSEVRLDVRHGVLTRDLQFRDADGRESRLRTRRIVSMARPHMAGIEWRLTPLNWSGRIEVRTALDGDLVNDNVPRYRGLSNRHLEHLGSDWEGNDGMLLSVKTNQSHTRMTQAARTRVFVDEAELPVERTRHQDEHAIAQHLFFECERHRTVRIEKIVAIRTSNDAAISEPQIAACEDIRHAGSFGDLLCDHTTRWRHLWSVSDIELHNGDIRTQLILRLHIFHILQSTSYNTIDRDVGVPARGWHGEAYRGHIFWDELFIFPLLTLRAPEVTRALLMYRYRRLDAARRLAKKAGFEGAMYPWQSGSDGREESQVVHLNPESGRWIPDTTYRQRHVNAAIAYNVWEYYQATGDNEFLAYYGAEMVLEIGRFWASIVSFDERRNRYVIEGVVGPDEFHTDDPASIEPGLSNNAYTNALAAWVLRCASAVLDRLEEERRAELCEALQIREEEIEQWSEISSKMFIPFHDDGIISQFEGYERLEEFDWDGYAARYGDIHRLDRILEAEGEDVNHYKASKQADVLMLFYLFSLRELERLFAHMGYAFNEDILRRNIDYYMQRTSHGSTLSQVVHSWVLARRDRKKAWEFWQRALRSDVEDIQGGTTPEGIHLGAMAGTVDLVHRGYTGLVMEEDTLWFDPMLPEELSHVRMRIRYHGHWLTVEVSRDEMSVTLDRGRLPSVAIGFRGKVIRMEQGERRTFALG